MSGMINYTRIVDLTLPLVPGQGGRPLRIERGRTEELTPHPPVEHPWYIMHRVSTISHIGTHIEAPYHCVETGRDLAGIPVEQLVGEAVVLDLSTLPPDTLVGAAELEPVIAAAGGIKQGDIALLRTGFAGRQDTPEYAHRPSLTAAAMLALVERGVKLVGTDLAGLEGPLTPATSTATWPSSNTTSPSSRTSRTSPASAGRASSSVPCRSRCRASTLSRYASWRSSRGLRTED